MDPTDQTDPTKTSNPDNLPVIEETSLHHIVLRVRDWQETIDKKFGRKEAYLEFENEEVNAYKKELLEKGEVDENLNPVDRFYHGVDYEMKRFHLIKDPKSGNWVDLSRCCEWSETTDKETKEVVRNLEIHDCYWEKWDYANDVKRPIDKIGYFVSKENLNSAIENIQEGENPICFNFNISFKNVNFDWIYSNLKRYVPSQKSDIGLSINGLHLEFENCKITTYISLTLYIKSAKIINSSLNRLHLSGFFESVVIDNSDFYETATFGMHYCRKMVIQNCRSHNHCVLVPDGFLFEDSLNYGEYILIDNIFHNKFTLWMTYRLKSKIIFLNPSSEDKSSGIPKLFDNSILEIIAYFIKEPSETAELYFSNTNFFSLNKINFVKNNDGKLKGLNSNQLDLNYLRTLKTPSGKSVLIEGKNNRYHQYSHTQHFNSDKKVASFMKDFGVAFETWARIEKSEDVFVSMQATNDGYNVTFESNSEFAINNIERYKKDFQDTISDKNKLEELKQKADTDDFNELISQIFKILSKQATYQGKLDTNSLFQLQANPNQLRVQIMQFIQKNEGNSQGIQAPNNQGQISKTQKNYFTEKLKPTKSKFIFTFLSLVVSSILGYFINQLPVLEGFSDVLKYSITCFLVLLLAVITYYNS